jgi:uncharacterized repeat protein (TIGR01451 family)
VDSTVQLSASGSRLRVDIAGTTILTSNTETATVNGGAGNDHLTVNSLTGVSGVTNINLNGSGGGDTFTVTPDAAITIAADGGGGTDSLAVATAGTTNPFVTVTSADASGSTGAYTFGNRAAVNFTQVEALQSPTNYLTVTKSTNLDTAPRGKTVMYTVTITNSSTGTAAIGVGGVAVSDLVPVGLSSVTWTAAFTAGSSGAATGTGAIDEKVNLAPGGSVTYTVTGTIANGVSGDVTNTATGSVPAGLTDNTTTDNTAMASTTVRLPAEPGPLVVGDTSGGISLFVPDPATGKYPTTPTTTITPFGTTGGTVRSATADVDGDGIPDLIVATGPGTQLLVTVISGADYKTVLVPAFSPFSGSELFAGGGFVSAADLDGDGKAEFVVTPDQGGGARVTIFKYAGAGKSPTVFANFLGIDDPAFRGGARSAMGDVNGDGTPDLVVAAG